MEEFFEFSGVMFWPDIGRSIVKFSFGQKDLRVKVIGYFDIGIAIVCFEEIIKFWCMLFDKIVF